MNETMTFGELVGYIEAGEYIAGDTFINELGQEIHFDGTSIKGLTEINMHSNWRYVDQAA